MIGGIAVLDGYDDVLVYALRPIPPKVVRYLAMTTENVAEYRTLEATRVGIQLAFGILFLGVTLVVLLSAIWLGIGFANRLVAPIRRADRRRQGGVAGKSRRPVQPGIPTATLALSARPSTR